MQVKAFGIRAKATWQSAFTCVLALAASFATSLPSPVRANSFALGVATTINFNGVGIHVDSFNSNDPNYSSGGLYDPSKATDKGDVITTGSNISIDNGTVMGHVRTGSNGVVSLASGGSVGSKEWVQSGSHGIQPGWWTTNMNSGWPNVTLPVGRVWLTPVAGNYVKIDPNTGSTHTYKYLLDSNAPWKLPVIDGSIYVNGKNVLLWVTGDNNGNGVALGTTDEIRIPIGSDGNPNNLEIYMGAPSADFGGNGFINDTGQAKNLKYFGLSSNTFLRVSSNGYLIGYIHAPKADFLLNAGGSSSYDFIGSSMTRSVTINGNFGVHFDESLNQVGPPFITSQPQDLTQLAGQDAIFRVFANGQTPLKFRWRFNGTNILNATNSSLALTNATIDLAGAYSVTVSNVFGSVTSNPAMLSIYPSAAAVLDPPVFTLDNQLQFRVSGVPQFLYNVEGSTNLIDWISLLTNSSPFIFTDPESTNFAQRFYRSQYLP